LARCYNKRFVALLIGLISNKRLADSSFESARLIALVRKTKHNFFATF